MLGTVVLALLAQQREFVNPTFVGSLDQAAGLLQAGGLEPTVGAEYRTVTVDVLSQTRQEIRTEIHAFVLTDPLTGAKTAVAWNGISYKPVHVGAPADLAKDVEAHRTTGVPFYMGDGAEFVKLGQPAGPIAAVLLHFNGRDDLAEKALGAVRATNQINLASAAAWDYEQVLLGRSVSFYTAGRDFDALLAGRSAKRFSKYSGELVLEGGRPAPGSQTMDPFDYSAWIATLTERASRPAVFDLSFVDKLGQKEKIAALKEAMVDVRDLVVLNGPDARQPAPMADWRLASEGEAGIEALLDLATDTRWTRSFGGMVPMLGRLRFFTVGELATRRLEGLFALGDFGSSPAESQANMRRYWASAKGKSQQEQWLIALEDDSLNANIWSKAAQNLTVPPWVTPTANGWSMESGDLPAPFTGPQLRWKEFKSKFDERVYAALEKRTRQQWDAKRPSPSWFNTLMAAAAWNPRRAEPLLIEAKELYMSRPDRASFASKIGPIVAALVYDGSPNAWDGYGDLVTEIKTGRVLEPDEVLAPLWQHPDDPVAREISAKVFGSDGPFAPSIEVSELITNLPIASFLPEYRVALAASLQDDAVVGSATRDGERTIRMQSRNGSLSWVVDPSTTDVAVGGQLPLRKNDLIAAKLDRMMKLEGFHIGLPMAKRDEYIAKMVTILKGESTLWLREGDYVKPHLPFVGAVFPTRAVWPAKANGIRSQAKG